LSNPALDPVNSYGNESANRRTLTLNDKNYVVERTGYFEKVVVDYTLQNIKADASLNYKISQHLELKYAYRFALLDNVYQRSNRFYLRDYFIQQHSLRLNSKSIELKAYWNNENTGKSYNLRSVAENIDKDFKKDDQWFNDYTAGYNNALSAGQPAALAHIPARSIADQGRLQPASASFKESLNRLEGINNWDIGAALRVKASILHAEAQVNLTESLLAALKKSLNIRLLVGADSRTYLITPDGNYFINPVKGKEFHRFSYAKTGGFISVTKKVSGDQVSMNATLRADKNDYFPATFNPRLSVVYSPDLHHHVRVSYQNGYRFPSIFEAYSNVNSGGVKRVGGLPAMSQGIFENAYLRASIDAFQAAVIKDVNTGGISRNAAMNKNRELLVKNNYTYLEPEMVNSLETGYKGLFLHSRLFVDIDFYYNKYHSFIAQVEMNIPHSKHPDSLLLYLNDKKLQDRYRMWTNSKTTVYNYGGSLALKYQFPKGYYMTPNLTLARLARKTTNDGLEDGFNTPQWITNTSLGNENMYKNFGGRVTYKWQSSYYWQSFIVNGQVPAYSTIDAQLTYTFQQPGVSCKIGATNITNHYYYSILGGPRIGGLYYTTITYNLP
jgi:iron complex outermembrane receptor protein